MFGFRDLKKKARVILAAAICPVKVAWMPMTRRTVLALVCVLLLQEAVLVGQYALQRGVFYPGGYDQVDYLLVLARTLAPDSAEGLLDLRIAQGWLLHLLAWPFAALGLPPVVGVHLPLLALESWLFLVARRVNPALGWLALGLFVAARAHESVYGGPADYRHDYLALVMFGGTALAACAAVPFDRLRPMLLAGLLAGLTVHARFLTSAYLVAALPWLVLAALDSPRGTRLRALRNLTLGLVVAVLVALPFYLLNREAIDDYYLQGHLASTAEAEARGFAGLSFADLFSYYLRNLVRAQLGAAFVCLALLAMAAGCAVRCRGGRLPRPQLLVVAGFLMPLPVLSLGLQRSQVVASVMVVPVVLGVVAAAAPMVSRPWLGRVALLLGGLGMLTLPLQVLGEGVQVREARLAAQHDLAATGLRRLARGLPEDADVTVSVLGLHEALSASMLRWMRFGERGMWGREVIGLLGHTIYRLTDDELRDKLLASDLVLAPDGVPLPARPLPSQQQLNDRQAELLRWLDSAPAGAAWDRRADLDFPLDSGTVRVWRRRGR